MHSRLAVVLWGVFGTTLIASAIVLLRACGVSVSLPVPLLGHGSSFCPAALPALSAEAERGAALRTLVGQLERKLAEKALACASISDALLDCSEPGGPETLFRR